MSSSNEKRLERLEAYSPRRIDENALRERLAVRLNGIAKRLRVSGIPPKGDQSIAEMVALAVTPEEIDAAGSALHNLLQGRGLR